MNTIEQEVTTIVSQVTKTPTSQLQPDTDLRAELNVDSLQGLQIVASIEAKFEISVPDEELDMYTSISAIAATIERLQAAPPL